MRLRLKSLIFAAAFVLSGSAAIERGTAQTPAAAEPGTLAGRLAAGRHYVMITRRNRFPRHSEGLDDWFTIDGYYRPTDGTWTSNAIGFPTPGTPWHSCPRGAECGGIHEPGMSLERWYRPEQNELVLIGQRLTFDAEGRVFHDGRQIGLIVTPDF